MTKKYDVAIIGAGTAGLTAQTEIAKHTDNYVVIDGGDVFDDTGRPTPCSVTGQNGDTGKEIHL